MDQVYYDIHEAAEYLRCSPHTLRQWISNKKHGLTAVRAGARVLLTKPEMDRFISASTVAAEDKKAEGR